MQGSQLSSISGDSNAEASQESESVDLNLGQLVYASNGAWAAYVQQGTWTARTGTPQVALVNSTAWCGRTWGDSSMLQSTLEDVQAQNGVDSGVTMSSGLADGNGQQCEVRSSLISLPDHIM